MKKLEQIDAVTGYPDCGATDRKQYRMSCNDGAERERRNAVSMDLDLNETVQGVETGIDINEFRIRRVMTILTSHVARVAS